MTASAILATSLVAVAQLLAVGIDNRRTARDITFSTILAQRKLEELRSQPNEPAAGGGVDRDVSGYVDYVDEWGRTIGQTGTFRPGGTAYVRRWQVEPLVVGGSRTVLLHVRVSRLAAQVGRQAVDGGQLPWQQPGVTQVLGARGPSFGFGGGP